MNKHTPLFEWQVAPADAEWPLVAISTPLGAPATTALDATAHWYTRRWLWGGVLTLLLLASAGGWLWYTAQAGLDQIEGELSSTVQIELASVAPVPALLGVTRTTAPVSLAWEKQFEREQNILHTFFPPDIPVNQLITDLETINLQGDRAVTEFVTTGTDGTQALRQTRFYHHTAEGWQRTQPDAELWGQLRRLESSHFIFQYRQNDAQAVAAVAPQIDTLYIELQRNFGLTPNGEKWVIEVRIEQVTGAIIIPRWAHNLPVVPSPAIYLAPAELSDEAILAQSIALPLIDYMTWHAIEEHTIPFHWQSLQPSLRLWQLWDLDAPLAQWRHDVVQWYFVDVVTDVTERYSVLPDSYSELCTMHSLWILSPLLVGIPLECHISEKGTWIETGWLRHKSSIHLDQLTIPRSGWESVENAPFRSAEVVVGATLIEYAVVAYGHDQLSVLLASLARHDDWDTLLPAVYGISASEFEQGWHAYLAKEYGVPP